MVGRSGADRYATTRTRACRTRRRPHARAARSRSVPHTAGEAPTHRSTVSRETSTVPSLRAHGTRGRGARGQLAGAALTAVGANDAMGSAVGADADVLLAEAAAACVVAVAVGPDIAKAALEATGVPRVPVGADAETASDAAA
ncbi:hypothetical protein BVIET440_120131 [Burkholderia vietnamiensis]|nr:hypothetical protein BVI2075_40056 [Burkholderia vietnamiensis]CAG9231902.1 hypothetical protein BVI1335_810003 [Burkholderia vietnamiensis]